jgi:inner membrane protein
MAMQKILFHKCLMIVGLMLLIGLPAISRCRPPPIWRAKAGVAAADGQTVHRAVGVGCARHPRYSALLVAGQKHQFEHGSRLPGYANGMHVALDLAELKAAGTSIPFGFTVPVRDRASAVVPVGSNNMVNMESNWAHPQFSGSFLPEARSVDDSGFKASWRVSAMASSAQQQLLALDGAGAAEAAQGPARLDSFGMGFIEPVNIYAQADRATKYGLLFVALTFAAFFVFEILKRLPIHPIQYLLVGLALIMFFLLLVSLSEHLDFLLSYLVASAACIALISFYLSAVLRSRVRAAGFGAGLVLLYSALYGLLSSENNALVLGTLLLFAALAPSWSLPARSTGMGWARWRRKPLP